MVLAAARSKEGWSPILLEGAQKEITFGGGNMSETVHIEYTVHIWKEGNQFVAHAMPLDVMSSGRSPDEARKALDEAVHLFLVTAADVGTLEEILQEAGYEFRQGNWVSPSWVAIERHSAVIGI
jgi:predicted RNase H-like HicB family nuclease